MPAIQHVSLEVEPGLVDEEVRFWEVLGFERIERPEGIGGSSFWLGAGDQAIHLLAVESPKVRATSPCWSLTWDRSPKRSPGTDSGSKRRPLTGARSGSRRPRRVATWSK